MKFTLLFPGQGSQHPGMGKFLYEHFSAAKHIFEEASDALKIDFKKLCFDGSEADLALTENTQPCLLLVSTVTQTVLRKELSIEVSSLAGHSIGEYAALVAAEALSFTDALKAVKIRGQAMQSAVPLGQGGMVAVMGLEPEQVQTLCSYVERESDFKPLSPANYNCPGQIVISGSQKAITWMLENAKAETIFTENPPKRMRFIPLQVSAPFHCAMMQPAEDKMREVLSSLTFNNANYPIVQNFTAGFEYRAENLRENLTRQVSAPVLWMQSMNLLKEKAMTTCIECGAGSVLKGLLKKIDSEAFHVFNTTSLEDIKTLENYLNSSH